MTATSIGAAEESAKAADCEIRAGFPESARPDVAALYWDAFANKLSRSGVVPPTGTIHPRQIFTCAPKFGNLTAAHRVRLGVADRQQRRSGVVPPTGTSPESSTSAKHFPKTPNPSTSPSNTGRILPYTGRALCRLGSACRGVPVGNSAGRGLHPRPERSTPAKYSPRFQIRKGITRNKSFNLFSILYFFALAWVDRSGRGYNPRPAQARNAPPLPNVCLQFQIRKARMPLVGCRLWNAGRALCRLGSACRGVPVGNRAGRGLNPRPERSTPAKYLPRFQIRKCITRNESFKLFSVICSSALAWVDRSGRGFNPRPAPIPTVPPKKNQPSPKNFV